MCVFDGVCEIVYVYDDVCVCVYDGVCVFDGVCEIVYVYDDVCVLTRLLTRELRLDMPPGCSPISASLLASSTLFTPQLGATLPLQRMWTFILQTGEKHR